MEQLDVKEKKLIYYLSGDLSHSLNPYKDIASILNVDENWVIEKTKYFLSNGYIRRFGATIRHQQSGYKANAMVVWQVDDDSASQYGHILSSKEYVSHCYLRAKAVDWPYNLYSMVHAKNEDDLLNMIKELSALLPGVKYLILKSLKEFKKDSIRYFNDEVENE